MSETHSIHHDGYELRLRHEGGTAIAELWTFGANLSETTLNTATGEVTVTSEFAPHVRGDERTKCSANCGCGWKLRRRDEGDTQITEVWAHGAKLSETALDTTGAGVTSVQTA